MSGWKLEKGKEVNADVMTRRPAPEAAISCHFTDLCGLEIDSYSGRAPNTSQKLETTTVLFFLLVFQLLIGKILEICGIFDILDELPAQCQA